MTQVTRDVNLLGLRDELLGIGLQAGLGFAAGGPVGALLQGGLAFANALFVNPEPQAGPSREGLPNEAFTSQDPVHGWDLIGPGRVGGLIAYASSRTTDDNELLDQAVVVSRGALGSLGTKAVVWINGQRVRFSRQAGTSPDGTATTWYEPEATGSSDGINIYVGSWDADDGLINRAPLVDDLLFEEGTSGYQIIQRQAGTTHLTLYTQPMSVSVPGTVHLLRWPGDQDEGDWLVDSQGRVYRWSEGFNLLGQTSLQAALLFYLATAVEAGGGFWQGIVGNGINWAGRCYFYTHFAAAGTQGAELRAASRGTSYARARTGGFVEQSLPEWTEDHKLEGWSWIHFVVGLNRSQRLEGTANPLPDETRQRPPKLSSAPGLVFELSGRTGVDSHPVRVAAWYLQQKGLDAGQIDGFETQAVASGSGRSAPGSTVIVPTYRFRGLLADSQRPLEVLRNLEFAAAGWIVSLGDRLRFVQQETARDLGEAGEGDLVGEASWDPMGRGTPQNTARMGLRVVDDVHPQSGTWFLPDVVNDDLEVVDGRRLVEDLGQTEYITDWDQGQWRLRLYAQYLAYRGRLVARLPAVDPWDTMRPGDRLAVRTRDWGLLAGYVEQAGEEFSGSIPFQLAVGPELDFDVDTDYRPLSQDLGEVRLDTTPPQAPIGLTVQAVAGGILVEWHVPPDADYDHTLVQLSASGAVVRTDPTAATPYNMLGIDDGTYEVAVAHVDDQQNATAFSTAIEVVVRSIEVDVFGFGDPLIPRLVRAQVVSGPAFLLPLATRNGGVIADATYSVASGLPTGLTFLATRVLTGTPTVAGNFSLLYQVVDNADSAEGFVRYEFSIEEPSAADPPTDPDAPENIRQSSDVTSFSVLKMLLDAPASDDAIAGYEVQYRPKQPTP